MWDAAAELLIGSRWGKPASVRCCFSCCCCCHSRAPQLPHLLHPVTLQPGVVRPKALGRHELLDFGVALQDGGRAGERLPCTAHPGWLRTVRWRRRPGRLRPRGGRSVLGTRRTRLPALVVHLIAPQVQVRVREVAGCLTDQAPQEAIAAGQSGGVAQGTVCVGRAAAGQAERGLARGAGVGTPCKPSSAGAALPAAWQPSAWACQMNAGDANCCRAARSGGWASGACPPLVARRVDWPQPAVLLAIGVEAFGKQRGEALAPALRVACRAGAPAEAASW